MLLMTLLLLAAMAAAPVIILMLMVRWALPESAEEQVCPAPLPRRIWSMGDGALWHAMVDWMRTKPLRLTHGRD